MSDIKVCQRRNQTLHMILKKSSTQEFKLSTESSLLPFVFSFTFDSSQKYLLPSSFSKNPEIQ